MVILVWNGCESPKGIYTNSQGQRPWETCEMQADPAGVARFRSIALVRPLRGRLEGGTPSENRGRLPGRLPPAISFVPFGDEIAPLPKGPFVYRTALQRIN